MHSQINIIFKVLKDLYKTPPHSNPLGSPPSDTGLVLFLHFSVMKSILLFFLPCVRIFNHHWHETQVAFGFYCCDKHRDRKQLGWETVYFILQLSVQTPSLRDARGGTEAETVGGALLTGLLHAACPACFHRAPRSTCLDGAPPPVS